MYTLLVVDDEKFAVQGISRGIDWSDIQIGTIYEAYDANEAIDILRQNHVDIMITDVEMPGLNGIKLLEWMNENSLNTKVIFLSGHAEFSYVQKALKLGSFDYLLKPVDHQQLKLLVAQAMEMIEKEHKIQSSSLLYEKYLKMWEANLPMMIQNFWTDILKNKDSFTPEKIETLLTQYKIPLNLQEKVIPILISIEDWKGDFSAKDEEVMVFGVQSAASDILLQSLKGDIIRDYYGTTLVLVYCSGEQRFEVNKIQDLCRNKCKELIEACDENYFAVVSCYIGEPSYIFELSGACNNLLNIENSNIKNRQKVFYEKEVTVQQNNINSMPWLADWYILFEMGKKNELMHKIKVLFESLEGEEYVTRETLKEIYYGINYMIFYTAHKKNIKLSEENKNIPYEEAVRSLSKLKRWAVSTLNAYFKIFDNSIKEESALIDKIKQYINDNLYKEFTREDIARSVYLNPAYLSRVFKNETGISLSDYTAELRMKRAKEMLVDSSYTVSSIAEELCYFNFSHFSKMFKKYIGVTPSEYRKMHHIEDK